MTADTKSILIRVTTEQLFLDQRSLDSDMLQLQVKIERNLKYVATNAMQSIKRLENHLRNKEKSIERLRDIGPPV